MTRSKRNDPNGVRLCAEPALPGARRMPQLARPREEPAVTDFLRPIKTTTLSDKWGLVQRHEFELRRRNGEWQKQVRETYDRGDGAAVLLCDVAARSVILTRQFRYPAHYRGENPFLIEVCAGKLEGDSAETCARKEAMEECGYSLERLDKAFD